MSLSGGGSGSARGLAVVSDKPRPAVPAMVPSQAGSASADSAGVRNSEMKPQQQQRSKREDCVRVKHDDCFSKWKILVGPSDWKEHAAGKIPDRFQINNLPSNYLGSGLYELGVTPPAWLPPQRSHNFLKPQDVVVVYLGCSDNVHQHLLRYGQTGAHLEGVRSTRLFAVKHDRGSEGWKAAVQNDERSTSFTRDLESTIGTDMLLGGEGSRPTSNGCNASMYAGDESAGTPSTSNQRSSDCGTSFDQIGSLSPRGPRLFSEVFAFGCSIAFRWAATDSKTAAERAEAELIGIFDYAWKRGGHFRQRSPDIVAKIVMAGALGSNDSSYGCFGDRSTRTWFFFQRACPGVTITARKPSLKEGNNNRSSARTNHSRVGDFFTLFRTSPHMLISRNAKNCEFTKLDIPFDRCGVPLENGSPCYALPVKGGKRCHLHRDHRLKQTTKSGRIAHTNNYQSSPGRDSVVPEGAESPILPGPEPRSSSSPCFPCLITPAISAPHRSSPEPKRRGSLSFTSWLRSSEIRMAKSREWQAEGMVPPRGEGPRRNNSTYSSILATTLEEAGLSNVTDSPLMLSSSMSPSRRQICGLRLQDGSVCSEPPRPERKRCVAHKGLRNQLTSKSPRASPRPPTSVNSGAISSSIPASFF